MGIVDRPQGREQGESLLCDTSCRKQNVSQCCSRTLNSFGENAKGKA